MQTVVTFVELFGFDYIFNLMSPYIYIQLRHNQHSRLIQALQDFVSLPIMVKHSYFKALLE